ncbi:MAG: C4-type zinc ribbon domain-containing protein [Candidatus Desulfofervidaceae bacterium]|nr:C4-type zinc ribbon domain-containing protein [Candidatus Desulfofervidaceae bacterium]
MREQLLNLIKLQELDLQITQISQKMKTEPEALLTLKQELAKAQEELAEAQKELAEKEKIKKDAEWELEECENRIKKSKQKMLEVKTNKEYQALLTEIDELEKMSSEWEEKILVALEEIEKAKKNVAEREKKVKELEQRLSEAKKRLESAFTNLKKELVELRKKREEMVQTVPEDLLRRYDFIRERRNGRAVVAVDAEVCEGCNMHIPPQQYNELLRSDKFMTCPTCQRIIYWKGILENNGETEASEE